jgi:hypothetical protein
MVGGCPRLDTREAAHILIQTTPRWRNWQTHYFEVVAGQPVQVQILSWAYEKAIQFGSPSSFHLLVTAVFPPFFSFDKIAARFADFWLLAESIGQIFGNRSWLTLATRVTMVA